MYLPIFKDAFGFFNSNSLTKVDSDDRLNQSRSQSSMAINNILNRSCALFTFKQHILTIFLH